MSERPVLGVETPTVAVRQYWFHLFGKIELDEHQVGWYSETIRNVRSSK